MPSGDGIQVLPAGAGYGIVIGIGGVFALMMLAITWLQNRYTTFSTKQAEEFNTASRSVKPGLIAAGIVSSWTWSATLLTSSTFAYSYGVCGPMWYGASGTLQILLFASIAIKIKSNAPGAHTFPEVVLARHGKVAHIVYLFSGICTNMLVGACLVLGGSQVVAAISGMNVYAACFLIPLVVAAYVIAGGLRSTFIADYVHTVVSFIAILVFGFSMYATSDKVGSISKFYDLLLEASENMPIAGNAGNGSYLAFRSPDGLVFAIDSLVAGFSTVWLDQAYWQRAIASKPETSVRAYISGGIAWYGIPFGFATAMGLGCAALTSSPSFPTYPNPLSAAQNGAGSSSPATAIALAGKGGAVSMSILLFMAVTSSTSAESIAVASLLTFDVYKTYFKPEATSEKSVQISHYGIVIYALALATFCSILNAVGSNLTWLLTISGIIVGGASIPVGSISLWKRMSTTAAVASPPIALCLGLIAWFVVSHQRSGEISIASTGDTTNAVAGNITSWGSGAILAVILTFAFPAKHSSTDPRHIERSNKIQGIAPTATASPASPEKTATPTEAALPGRSSDEKAGLDISAEADRTASTAAPESYIPTGNELVDFLERSHIEPMDPIETKKATKSAVSFNVVFILVAFILVPFTSFGTGWVYNRHFFTGWVVMSFIWVWVSMIICVIYPVVESAGALRDVSKGLWADFGALFGGKKGKVGGRGAGDA